MFEDRELGIRHFSRPQTQLHSGGTLPGKVTTILPQKENGGDLDSPKTLLSLFDYSGAWAKPFEDAGWTVHQWDIKLSEFMDINLIEDASTALELFEDINGIIAAPPCTDFSSSGAHAWKFKDEDGRTHQSVELVAQVQRLVSLFAPTDPEYDEPWFWAIENPVGRMGELTGLGKPWYFQPCEFAGWLEPSEAEIIELERIRTKSLTEKITRKEGDFVMSMEAYTKKTGIWGAFKTPENKPLEPVYVTSSAGERFSPVAWFTGGKSAKTKELRSNTPYGFALAFYEANKNHRAQFKPGYWEAQGWSAKEAKKFYEDSKLEKGGMFHVTHYKNEDSILKKGILINQPKYKTEAGVWAKEIYGMSPVYVSFSPEKTRKQQLLGKNDSCYQIDASGYNLVADLPSIINHGAYISDKIDAFYWMDGEEPKKLKKYIDEDGMIYFEDLLNPDLPVTKAAIKLTGSAAILENIPLNRIKKMKMGGAFPELRTNEAFEIIDADENLAGGDWTAGACHPLALALKDIYGGDLVVIKADGLVQHVMVKIGDKYLDADGLQDEETKFRNFEADSVRLRNEWQSPPVITEFKQEECGGLGQGSKETIEKIKALLQNKLENGGKFKTEKELEQYLKSLLKPEKVYQKVDYNFRLIDKVALQKLPSASAIECFDGKLYIAGDDSPNLLIVDTDLRNEEYVRLFPGEGRIPKFEKHDIEASAIYKNNLLLVSSASLPGREVILDIPINEPEKFETHSTKIFFDRVRAQIKDINIEGMSAIAGLCFVFASRGHRKQPQNYLIATNTNFYRHQSDANIVPIKLNFKSPEIGVSGLCYLANTDTLLFTASSEDSLDAISDGAIGNSHLGWINDFSQKINQEEITPDRMFCLNESAHEFNGEKIESICVEDKFDNSGRYIIHMVSDNDNGTSNIFKAVVNIAEPQKANGGELTEADIPKYNEGGQLELFAAQEIVTPEETRTIAEIIRAQRESEPDPQLTLLSFGGGQDSFAILYSLIHDKAFRKKYAPNDLVVAMSDTGNEFPYTYKAVKDAQELCKQHGIEFVFITPDMGYHTAGWQDLKANLRRNKVILGAAMGSKACTISLKINVVDKFMHHHMCSLYGFEEKLNKQSWEFYHKKFGTKARVLIGFAKNEEVRVVRSNKIHQFLPNWKRKNIQYVYPLIEEGWDRAIAQQIIGKYRKDIPPPSNCMICFYQSDQEIVWLERNYPAEFADWVELERAKLARFEGKVEKNYGVYGALNLLQKLEQAKKKMDKDTGKPIGEMTNEELWEYKMSHGHCVKSTY